MSFCEKCYCYDDSYVDGEDITEEELEKDPLYDCLLYTSPSPRDRG